MPPFSFLNRQRGFIIVTAFLFWLVAICLPTVHFEPGNLDAVKQVLRRVPASFNFLIISIAAIAAMAVGLVFIWAAKRSRRKKKKDDAPHERYREPVPTPYTVYLIIALFFASAIGFFWWARQPSLPESLFHTSGQSPLQTPGQTENAPQLFPAQGASEHRTLAEQMLKYLLAPSLSAVLSWIVWRRRKDRSALISEETAGLSSLTEQTAMDSENGGELPDVLLRCYRDMCRILSSRVAYPKEMTAREFASRCREAGLQALEVSRLTELFERVHYGRHVASPEEQIESIALLKAIERQHGKPIP